MNFIAIVNSKNKFFSGVKQSSPKMINAMKELCVKYTETYKEEYKVKRVIMTRNGWKIA